MGITEKIVAIAIAFITSTGYFGVFILMVLESMVFPIPSEAVMPFAGFFIFDGKMTWTAVILVSTFGSIVGSLASYFIGFYGGKPFISKFGKYLLLNQHHLEIAENFFDKRGEITILISRFIPIVRHIISIPAGFGKMNIFKFITFTLVGASIWNSFLAYVGYILRENWEEVMKYSHTIDVFVVAIILIAFIYFVYKLFKDRQSKK
ncbi:MAG: hypothetical protein AUJ98_08445 [Bacteroidetes bacterium CG2_30_33_31]|nr:MAG: hypothetical protein AUJ98_08445 [Bacteroidetes bacterium CG2_30_33_31]